jgi:hypothetical protein
MCYQGNVRGRLPRTMFYPRDVSGRPAGVRTDRARRQKIQLAAEFLWPSTDPVNAGVRAAFRLPADRPYVG